MKEENQKEVETVMVAVGVILLVAGVKHGLTNLVEQWRALVFLFLNLLLLTIVFTSIRSNKAETHAGSGGKEEKKTVSDKKLKSSASSSWPVQVDDLFFEVEEETATVTVAPEPGKEEVVQVEVGDEAEAEVDEGQQVSKEELNARVESFITMFRHQLALDAKENSRHSFSPVVSKGSPVTVR